MTGTRIGGTDVPSAYVTMVKWAAGVIGMPVAVVAAQWNEESGFNPGATSPAGAEGIAQFEPSTWSGLGCSGSPYDPSSASKCYAKYMYQLVKQYKGNIRDALAAYNAGPGDLAAGYGYADTILAAAGESQDATGSGGSGDTGTGAPTDATLTAAQTATCLIGFSGNIPIIPGIYSQTVGACFMSKSQGRAVGSVLVIAAGGVVMIAGLVLVMSAVPRLAAAAATLNKTPGVAPVAQQAGKVPAVEPVPVE